MSYRGIKRTLGESSLERKILILFGICLLLLIGGSFLSVNQITNDLIRSSTRDKAKGLKRDYILRTHLENLKFVDGQAGAEELFKDLAIDSSAIQYEARALVLSDQIGRHQLSPYLVTTRTVLGDWKNSGRQRLNDRPPRISRKSKRRPKMLRLPK